MEKRLLMQRAAFTAVITAAVWLFLAWEHYSGGVAVHHLLGDKKLPGISNWWGGLLIPVLAWFLLYRIQKRIFRDAGLHSWPPAYRNVAARFFCALLFGALLSVFFAARREDLPGYMLLALLLTAFFKPVYRAEYLLGFVLGMTFTFGTVLPTLIGSVLTAVTAFIYLVIRRGVLLLTAKFFR